MLTASLSIVSRGNLQAELGYSESQLSHSKMEKLLSDYNSRHRKPPNATKAHEVVASVRQFSIWTGSRHRRSACHFLFRARNYSLTSGKRGSVSFHVERIHT